MIPDEIDVPHAVVRVLEEAGIPFVFGMPGGDTGRIFDALYDSTTVQTILVRHEQVGSIMAEMCGRLTGKPESSWARASSWRATRSSARSRP